MIKTDQLGKRFYPLLLLLAFTAWFVHQSLVYAEDYGVLTRCYIGNTLLAALIHFIILRSRERHSEKTGFIFLIGSSLKFLFYFVIIHPIFNADGDISNVEFGAFFIPYSLTTVFETTVLVRYLNRF